MNEHNHDQGQDEPVICPWCQTEIVWDEELGPERYCPHCENELSGYRTLQLGLDDEEEDEEEADSSLLSVKNAAAGNGSGDGDGDYGDDAVDFSEYSSDRLALNGTMERLLEDQLEAPECPTCHELMLETGTSTITADSFKPRTPAALGKPVLQTPLSLVLYVCPSCFHAEQRLSVHDQEKLLQTLAHAVDE